MPTDHPDGTRPIVVSRADIQLPIDIQAVSLGNISIDISAQTIGNLTISIDAQEIGIYVIRDWETWKDHDKSLTGSVEIDTYGDETVLDYPVPANKVMYLDDFSPSGTQKGHSALEIGGTTVFQICYSDYTPCVITFTTPKKATAGEHIIVNTHNGSDVLGVFKANVGGREIAA